MSWNTTPEDMGLPGSSTEAKDVWARWNTTRSLTNPPTPNDGAALRPHTLEDDNAWPPALPPRTPIQAAQDERRAERTKLAQLDESHRRPIQEGYRHRAGAATAGHNTPARPAIPARLQRVMETGGYHTPLEAARSIQTTACPTPMSAHVSKQLSPKELHEALAKAQADSEAEAPGPTSHGPDASTLPPTPISHSVTQSGLNSPRDGSHASSSTTVLHLAQNPPGPPGPPPGRPSGYNTPVSETGYVMRGQTASAPQPAPREQPTESRDTARTLEPQPTPNIQPISWRDRNGPIPQYTPVPCDEVVATMATGRQVIRGEARSHAHPTGHTERRYWSRVANLYEMLDTYGREGWKGVDSNIITLPDGYTNAIRELEPLTRDHIKSAPFYFLVPRELERLVTRADDPAAGTPHPLTTRLPQESLTTDPTGRWANFQGSSTDQQDLTTWAVYNAIGQAPAGIQGWLLGEDKPRDESGKVIHYDQRQGTYHPRLVRNIGHQPKVGQTLCRSFKKSGRCNQNSNCPLLHDPQNGMYCRKFLRGEPCTQLRLEGRCDHIHGTRVDHPTGSEAYGAGDELAFTPETMPDLLTSSTCAPPLTAEHRAKVRYPVWIPVPSPSAYNRFRRNMDSHMYGTTESPERYSPPVMPTPVPRLQNAIHHLMETINSEQTLPSEVALALLNQHIRAMIDDLPDLSDTYDESQTRITGRRTLDHDIRPTSAVDLRNQMANIKRFLRDRANHVQRNLEEAIQNLTDRPDWDRT